MTIWIKTIDKSGRKHAYRVTSSIKLEVGGRFFGEEITEVTR